MTLTLVFESTQGGQALGTVNIGSASAEGAVPTIGDDVQWVANGQTYQGLVKRRVISYSKPEMAVGRDDVVDAIVKLIVEVG